MDTKVQTQVTISDEARDEVSKLQDRIHEKHSGLMNDLAHNTAENIRDVFASNWSARAKLDAYYMDRRAAEREYVGALNATARIERFLSK